MCYCVCSVNDVRMVTGHACSVTQEVLTMFRYELIYVVLVIEVILYMSYMS